MPFSILSHDCVKAIPLARNDITFNKKIYILRVYPDRKTSVSLRKTALIKIGKGNRSTSDGTRTIASHCSPTLGDLSPTKTEQILL